MAQQYYPGLDFPGIIPGPEVSNDDIAYGIAGVIENADGEARIELAAAISDLLSVKAFGAVGDGVTDDTAAFQRAIDAATAAGGGTILVPSGKYIVSNNVRLQDEVYLQGEGYGSWIHSVATSGFSRCAIISGNFGDIPGGNGLYSETKYDIHAAEPGDNSVTLVTPSDAAKFVVGDIVGVASFEKWALPPIDDHEKIVNLNEVVEVSGSGVTLRYALKDFYSSATGNPTIRRVSGTFNGYDGRPLWASKNCGASNLRVTQTTGLTSGWYAIFPCGVNQRYENIWLDNCSTSFGTNGLSHSIIRNIQCSFEGGYMDLCDWQNDNLVENIFGTRFAANAALNRIGLALNNGTDIIVRNATGALGGFGRFSAYLVYRAVFERCMVIDAGSNEAILLGVADDCEAFGCTITNPFKNGIGIAGQRHKAHNNRIASVGTGGFSVQATAGVVNCYVHDNQFGVEGGLTPFDRFDQIGGIVVGDGIYNNTGYVEYLSRVGGVNWAGNAQSFSTSNVVLKTGTLKGTSGTVRGFHIYAAGARTGTAGTKALKMVLGGVTIATITYSSAVDTAPWEMSAVINVRTATNAAHVNGRGIKGTAIDFSQMQIIANALVSDTTLTVEGSVANAADSVVCYQFIIEPITELIQ